jgi:hypothetical protein
MALQTADQPATATEPSRRRGTAIVVAGCAVLVVEMLLRVGGSALPSPASREWSSDRQVKYEQMRMLRRRFGGADTVFVGSSLMAMGVDPRLIPRPPGGRPDYNAAFSGARIQELELWIRDVVIPLLRPHRVVVGLGLIEATSDNPEFDQQPAVRKLEHRESALQRADRGAQRWSAIWRYRRVLRQPINAAVWRTRHAAAPVDDFGGQAGRISRLGLETPTPAKGPKLGPGRYLVYDSLTASRAVRKLLTSLQPLGVEVTLVSVPVSKTGITKFVSGPGVYDEHIRDLTTIASSLGLTFVQGGVWDDALFWDPFHIDYARGRSLFTDYFRSQPPEGVVRRR